MARRTVFAVIFALLFVLLAQVPRVMSYQGKITTSDGVALNGTDTIAFCIYDTSEAGTPLWGETLAVDIVNGLFDVMLGNVHPIDLDFSKPYWLELSISTDGGVSWETFSPREKIASVGYAFRAVYADSVEYAASADNDWTIAGVGTLYSYPDSTVTIKAQRVGIGTNSPDEAAVLDIVSTSGGVLFPRMTTAQRDSIESPSNGLVIFNLTTNCLEIYIGKSWYPVRCPCTFPDVPVATGCTDVSQTQFKVHWNTAEHADGYYLCVAEDSNFTTFVPGYENLDVGNVTEYTVTDLTCETVYYSCVRAYNNCAVTGYSNIVTCTTSVCCSIPPNVIWYQTFNPTSRDEAINEIAIDDSAVYICGYDNLNSEMRWRVQKRSLDDGSLIWNVTYYISGSKYNVPYGLAVDTSGVYVCGRGGMSAAFGVWRVEKRSLSDGSIIWSSNNTYGSGDNRAEDIAVDSTGVYVCGHYGTNSSYPEQDWKTRVEKRSLSDGSLIWAKNFSNSTYTFQYDESATSICVDTSGVYVAMYYRVDTYDRAWRIEKRSLDDGSLIWAQGVNYTGSDDIPREIVVDATGVYVAGYCGNNKWRIEKRSLSDGSLLWGITEDLTGSEERALGIALDSTGVYVCGFDDSLGNYQWRIEKRSLSDGSLIWTALSNPSSGNDAAKSIAVGSTGFYVGGYDRIPGNSQWRLEKYCLPED